ncbi:hypothetical protein Tco_1189261 [Tanacetum coccineum]
MLPRVFKPAKPRSYSKVVVRHSLTPKEVLQSLLISVAKQLSAAQFKEFMLLGFSSVSTVSKSSLLAGYVHAPLEGKIRMEQYLQCIDYTLWEIIENGNAPIVTKTVDGKETVILPTSVEEKAQRRA